ncbi:MAG: CRISPR system precrRNA processing endoribonuclease RAMP protein Cas6, partial [Gammaproteobacteria bacterium]|nr:CRISPR system precrRNA processing endoribonuclease RAMP protein Cas6 [Gammaproteobacteria bacterium]NIR92622.1 CRISPR system precrRNA processing endoribonuclease RAMP protein Cas6 [Gammaproteobacteria bacterium]
WQDWRNLGKQGMAVGGFVGEIVLDNHDLEDIFWVLAVISLFGVGKGATYGAGQVKLLN